MLFSIVVSSSESSLGCLAVGLLSCGGVAVGFVSLFMLLTRAGLVAVALDENEQILISAANNQSHIWLGVLGLTNSVFTIIVSPIQVEVAHHCMAISVGVGPIVLDSGVGNKSQII